MVNFLITSLCSLQLIGFSNVNLAFYLSRIMPDRCVVHGCSNRSNVKAGISAHFSPIIKSERDKRLRFVRTHRANFNPTGEFTCGVFCPLCGGILFKGDSHGRQ